MMSLRLLNYTLGIRIRALLSSNRMQVLWKGLIILYVFGQAVVMSIFLNNARKLNLSPQPVIGIINLMILVITLVRNFFPAYRPTSVLIRAFHPMSRKGRTLFNIFHDIFSGYLFLAVGFYLILCWFSDAYDASEFLRSVQIFLTALFLERSIRLTIEYCINARVLHGLTIVLTGMLLIWGGLQHAGLMEKMLLHSWLTSAILLMLTAGHHTVLAYLVESPEMLQLRIFMRKEISSSIERNGNLQLGLEAYYKNRIVRITLGTAICAKIFVLAFMGWLYMHNRFSAFPFMAEIATFLVASPVMYFTHIFSNTFGHRPSLWQTLHINRGDLRTALKIYLELLSLPLALDLVLSLGVTWLVGLLSFQFLVFYFGSLLSLIPIGFLGSVFMPVKVIAVPSFTNFRSNVSVIITFLALLIVGLYAILRKTTFFYGVVGLITFALWSTIFNIHINYRKYRKLKQKAYVVLHS